MVFIFHQNLVIMRTYCFFMFLMRLCLLSQDEMMLNTVIVMKNARLRIQIVKNLTNNSESGQTDLARSFPGRQVASLAQSSILNLCLQLQWRLSGGCQGRRKDKLRI